MKKIIVILGVVGTSLSAVFVKLADAPSMVLVLYRVGFAAVILFPYLLIKHRRELKSIPKRNFLLSAVSGMFLGFHFTAYFQSLRYTSIASSVVLVDTEVFFIALMTFLFLKEKLGKKCWIGILVTFAGSVTVAFADAGGGSNILLGDVIALTGAICMSFYTMLGASCRKRMSTTVYTFFVYAFAALTVLLILCVRGVKLFGYGKINLVSGLGMALFCTLLGHSLFSWGLKYEKPAYVSAVKMLEPVFATVFGILIFSQIPSVYVIAGGSMIIAGIIYYTVHNFRKEKPPGDLPAE
jgi:Permeases of the drug/metabolite transporter (DMT) superfamily